MVPGSCSDASIRPLSWWHCSDNLLSRFKSNTCSAIELHPAATSLRSEKSKALLGGEQNSLCPWWWCHCCQVKWDNIKVSRTRENFPNTTLRVCVYINDIRLHTQGRQISRLLGLILEMFYFLALVFLKKKKKKKKHSRLLLTSFSYFPAPLPTHLLCCSYFMLQTQAGF